MKRNNLNTYLSGAILTLLLILGLTACNNGEQGWPADSSYDRLFRPLTFSQYSLDANSVGVSFTKVVDAKKYIFEVSEDSLQFNRVVERRTILADTLTPFSPSSTLPKTEYRIKFTELNANSQYSIRMIAVNEDSTLTSKYAQFAFKTKAENIFNGLKITESGATLTWAPTGKVSYLVVTKDADPTKNILQADSVITGSEKADTTKSISGLEMGTYYTAKICYVDGLVVRVRGTKTFKTPGTAGSYSYNLQPTDTVASVLTRLVADGHKNISLILIPEATYNWGVVNLPAGITMLTVTAPTGTRPTVNVDKIVPASSMDGFLFEHVTMVGASNTATQLFYISTDNLMFNGFTFDGCFILNYNCLVRFANKLVTASDIVINNSEVINTGGYGVLNVAGASAKLSNIKITNSTFIDLTTQLMDIRTKLSKVEIANCTFYNNSTTNKLTQVLRFVDNATAPSSMIVDKCIFAGNNGGTALKSFSGNFADYATFSFATNYKTSDLSVSTSTGTGFTGISALSKSSTDLFTDPTHWNFKIKPEAGFAGQGIAGDPRWW